MEKLKRDRKLIEFKFKEFLASEAKSPVYQGPLYLNPSVIKQIAECVL